MKTLLILLASAAVAFGAAGDLTIRDDLAIIIEDAQGNLIVAGSVGDAAKNMPKAKVQTVTDAYLNSKIGSNKRKATLDGKVIKDAGLTIPSKIVEDVQKWLNDDSNDSEKAKALNEVLQAAEGIGAVISQGAKDKIEAAKPK